MATALIIISVLLWGASLWACLRRRLLAPGLSYLALLAVSLADTPEGYPLLPVNSVILTGWLCMTIVVMVATTLQPRDERRSAAGAGYMTLGALAGMAVGLLGFTLAEGTGMRYSIMVVATAAGVLFGYLMYGNTPAGRAEAPGRARFAGTLLAKGFPIAIAVMQLGVALVLAMAIYLRP